MSAYPLGKELIKTEIHYENFQEGIEKFYFTVVDIIENSLGYKINKTEDQFLTSPGSAQWQVFEQRKASQQEKASQYLANIGRMTKDMMLLYRELKIQDERLGFYKEGDKGSNAAELSLKSLWIDITEGGAKNPTSVLGLAQQVGFVTLPDLFFRINPKTVEDVDKFVSKVETNSQVKNVLKRKLIQYVKWRERTYQELTTRRHFNIKYLFQHFNVIKMYLDWAKPYLKNIKNLNQRSKGNKEYQILQTSESSISDIEILCRGKDIDAATEYKYMFPLILITFHHRTRPVMAYQGHDYSKGAIQLGRIECEIRGFNATQKEYEDYMAKKDLDTFELWKSVDASMNAFLSDDNSKEDFEKYLTEARDNENKINKPKQKGSILDMFKFNFKKSKNQSKKKVPNYLPFINDYHHASNNTKKNITKSTFSKLRRKHKISKTLAEKESRTYENNEKISKVAVKSAVEELVRIIKINYGMIRNE